MNVTSYVTRDLLGKTNLQINDHDKYSLTPSIMGGQIQWEKKEVSSPWVDGEFTVSRRKRNVVEALTIDVYGASTATLQTNIATLIEAMTQDNYAIYFNINSTLRIYRCFAADYQVSWDRARMEALTVPVVFNVPRLPNPLSGV